VGPECGVVELRRQRQRCAAAPTANELGGDQFQFRIGASIVSKESIEGTDTRLILAEAYISAVATKYVRLRHRKGTPSLTWISEDELAGLDWPSLARQGLDTAALDRRLVDAILVAERIAIARLRTKILYGQDSDSRHVSVLLAHGSDNAPPLFL